MLTEKQLKVIERLVTGEETGTEIIKDLGIPESTFYKWKRENQLFINALDEAVELKVKEAKKNIKINVHKYINRLDKLSQSDANQMASINAITKLLDLAELFNNTQEITIKSADTEEKNELLSMLKKDKDQQDDEQIH